jgi:hypothetical protein
MVRHVHMDYITGILSYVFIGNLSHRDDIPDTLDIPSSVPLYLIHNGTATHTCLA